MGERGGELGGVAVGDERGFDVGAVQGVDALGEENVGRWLFPDDHA